MTIPLLQKTLGPKTLKRTILFFDPDNSFDQFETKVCEKEGQKILIGLFLREISCVANCLIDSGANITVTLTNDHYRRSPLVQGGMEIAYKVKASVSGTCIIAPYRKI